MIVRIRRPDGPVQASLFLPASKSISNRVLIIHALGNLKSPVINLSDALDTVQLQQALHNTGSLVHAGEGGTTLRFLLAYFAVKGKEIAITASGSLRKRPVAPLIEALRNLGARIKYTSNENDFPLTMRSGGLQGGSLTVQGDISSQFISALMLIGPYVPGGISITLTGEVLSLPYIQMTRSVMRYFGADVFWEDNTIRINEGRYTEREITIEPDWSAASYWFEAAALSDRAHILLHGLREHSLQGDSRIRTMTEAFGVSARFSDEGLLITKNDNAPVPDYFTDDFSGCPDLGPAMAGICAGLNVTADLQGLRNFRLKESDRASALQRELYNLGVRTDFCGGSKFKIYNGKDIRSYSRPLKSYNDHRIAMALAPLALKTGELSLESPDVVGKSYPLFWDDMKRAGFGVEFSG